jgi:alpha-ketoglutarate-dependent taurine dioxygenase
MCDLLLNVLGTIIGGLLLTFLLFILNEFVFRKANLSGDWTATVQILRTTYRPYENLKIEYQIQFLQKGYEISGSGEKIKDINQDGTETTFEREKRVIIDVEGYYERKYLGKSKLFLNITEVGRKRESRASYQLTIKGKKQLKGTFSWTAADARGEVIMKKV